MANITIRQGVQEDILQVFNLIKELAIYEKLPNEVDTTVAQLIEDGFGANPIFGLIVAEQDQYIIGTAIYYFRYSTWKGKRLYLEDLIVTEKMREQGIGKQLFDATVLKAKELNCNGMNWLVLDWNKSAMSFYDKYNPEYDPTWVLASLTKDQVMNFEQPHYSKIL